MDSSNLRTIWKSHMEPVVSQALQAALHTQEMKQDELHQRVPSQDENDERASVSAVTKPDVLAEFHRAVFLALYRQPMLSTLRDRIVPAVALGVYNMYMREVVPRLTLGGAGNVDDQQVRAFCRHQLERTVRALLRPAGGGETDKGYVVGRPATVTSPGERADPLKLWTPGSLGGGASVDAMLGRLPVLCTPSSGESSQPSPPSPPSTARTPPNHTPGCISGDHAHVSVCGSFASVLRQLMTVPEFDIVFSVRWDRMLRFLEAALCVFAAHCITVPGDSDQSVDAAPTVSGGPPGDSHESKEGPGNQLDAPENRSPHMRKASGCGHEGPEGVSEGASVPRRLCDCGRLATLVSPPHLSLHAFCQFRAAEQRRMAVRDVQFERLRALRQWGLQDIGVDPSATTTTDGDNADAQGSPDGVDGNSVAEILRRDGHSGGCRSMAAESKPSSAPSCVCGRIPVGVLALYAKLLLASRRDPGNETVTLQLSTSLLQVTRFLTGYLAARLGPQAVLRQLEDDRSVLGRVRLLLGQYLSSVACDWTGYQERNCRAFIYQLVAGMQTPLFLYVLMTCESRGQCSRGPTASLQDEAPPSLHGVAVDQVPGGGGAASGQGVLGGWRGGRGVLSGMRWIGSAWHQLLGCFTLRVMLCEAALRELRSAPADPTPTPETDPQPSTRNGDSVGDWAQDQPATTGSSRLRTVLRRALTAVQSLPRVTPFSHDATGPEPDDTRSLGSSGAETDGGAAEAKRDISYGCPDVSREMRDWTVHPSVLAAQMACTLSDGFTNGFRKLELNDFAGTAGQTLDRSLLQPVSEYTLLSRDHPHWWVWAVHAVLGQSLGLYEDAMPVVKAAMCPLATSKSHHKSHTAGTSDGSACTALCRSDGEAASCDAASVRLQWVFWCLGTLVQMIRAPAADTDTTGDAIPSTHSSGFEQDAPSPTSHNNPTQSTARPDGVAPEWPENTLVRAFVLARVAVPVWQSVFRALHVQASARVTLSMRADCQLQVAPCGNPNDGLHDNAGAQLRALFDRCFPLTGLSERSNPGPDNLSTTTVTDAPLTTVSSACVADVLDAVGHVVLGVASAGLRSLLDKHTHRNTRPRCRDWVSAWCALRLAQAGLLPGWAGQSVWPPPAARPASAVVRRWRCDLMGRWERLCVVSRRALYPHLHPRTQPGSVTASVAGNAIGAGGASGSESLATAPGGVATSASPADVNRSSLSMTSSVAVPGGWAGVLDGAVRGLQRGLDAVHWPDRVFALRPGDPSAFPPHPVTHFSGAPAGSPGRDSTLAGEPNRLSARVADPAGSRVRGPVSVHAPAVAVLRLRVMLRNCVFLRPVPLSGGGGGAVGGPFGVQAAVLGMPVPRALPHTHSDTDTVSSLSPSHSTDIRPVFAVLSTFVRSVQLLLAGLRHGSATSPSHTHSTSRSHTHSKTTTQPLLDFRLPHDDPEQSWMLAAVWGHWCDHCSGSGLSVFGRSTRAGAERERVSRQGSRRRLDGSGGYPDRLARMGSRSSIFASLSSTHQHHVALQEKWGAETWSEVLPHCLGPACGLTADSDRDSGGADKGNATISPVHRDTAMSAGGEARSAELKTTTSTPDTAHSGTTAQTTGSDSPQLRALFRWLRNEPLLSVRGSDYLGSQTRFVWRELCLPLVLACLPNLPEEVLVGLLPPSPRVPSDTRWLSSAWRNAVLPANQSSAAPQQSGTPACEKGLPPANASSPARTSPWLAAPGLFPRRNAVLALRAVLMAARSSPGWAVVGLPRVTPVALQGSGDESGSVVSWRVTAAPMLCAVLDAVSFWTGGSGGQLGELELVAYELLCLYGPMYQTLCTLQHDSTVGFATVDGQEGRSGHSGDGESQTGAETEAPFGQPPQSTGAPESNQISRESSHEGKEQGAEGSAVGRSSSVDRAGVRHVPSLPVWNSASAHLAGWLAVLLATQRSSCQSSAQASHQPGTATQHAHAQRAVLAAPTGIPQNQWTRWVLEVVACPLCWSAQQQGSSSRDGEAAGAATDRTAPPQHQSTHDHAPVAGGQVRWCGHGGRLGALADDVVVHMLWRVSAAASQLAAASTIDSNHHRSPNGGAGGTPSDSSRVGAHDSDPRHRAEDIGSNRNPADSSEDKSNDSSQDHPGGMSPSDSGGDSVAQPTSPPTPDREDKNRLVAGHPSALPRHTPAHCPRFLVRLALLTAHLLAADSHSLRDLAAGMQQEWWTAWVVSRGGSGGAGGWLDQCSAPLDDSPTPPGAGSAHNSDRTGGETKQSGDHARDAHINVEDGAVGEGPVSAEHGAASTPRASLPSHPEDSVGAVADHSTCDNHTCCVWCDALWQFMNTQLRCCSAHSSGDQQLELPSADSPRKRSSSLAPAPSSLTTPQQPPSSDSAPGSSSSSSSSSSSCCVRVSWRRIALSACPLVARCVHDWLCTAGCLSPLSHGGPHVFRQQIMRRLHGSAHRQVSAVVRSLVGLCTSGYRCGVGPYLGTDMRQREHGCGDTGEVLHMSLTVADWWSLWSRL